MSRQGSQAKSMTRPRCTRQACMCGEDAHATEQRACAIELLGSVSRHGSQTCWAVWVMIEAFFASIEISSPMARNQVVLGAHTTKGRNR